MNGGNFAIPINHKRGGQRFYAAIKIARLVVAEYDSVVDFLLGHERRNRLPAVIIHGDAQNFEATIFVTPLKIHKPGDLNRARSAPGCPEIEQHHFTLEIGQFHNLARRVFQLKLGSVLPVFVGAQRTL